jgi:transcriptional regulator
MLILKTLTRANLHGYAIVQAIQASSNNELLIEEGSLYPALQRLELHGWIDGEWGLTPRNRRARIYRVAPSGHKQLERETERYKRLTLAIGRVMETG